MKKIYSILSIAFLALFATSCSEEVENGNYVKPGEPINFTGSILSDVKTRTVYGDKTSTGWPINWVEGDKVDVFCPEAQGEDRNAAHKNTASYTLTSAATGASNIYNLKSSENTLYWGEAEMHHFYEFYPSGNFGEMKASSEGTKCTVKGSIPYNQSYDRDEENQGTNGNYVFCNMDYALMAGATSADRTEVPNPLSLKFKPVTTAVDIVIEATNVDYNIYSITVANVETETSPSPLAGSFTFDISNDNDNKIVVDNYKSVDPRNNIQIEFSKPVFLKANDGKTLTVTAFLRGDFAKALKVVVNAETYKSDINGNLDPVKVSVKKQGLKDSDNNKLLASKRNVMNLGVLPSQNVPTLMSDAWLSALTDRTYVSQMSIPGAYDAANFGDDTSGCDRAQTKLGSTVEAQVAAMLDHGIRAFDMKLTCNDENGTTWSTNRMWSTGEKNSQVIVNFKSVMEAAEKWLDKHTTEFLIFIMSDYEWNTSNSYYANNIRDLIVNNTSSNRYLTSFDADLTIGEARGKILFVNATPYTNSIGIDVKDWPLNDKTVYSADKTKGDYFVLGSKGKIWIEDFNNAHKASLGWDVDGNYMTDKAGYIDTSLEAAAGDSEKTNWYYTSIAYRYHYNGTWLHTQRKTYSNIARETKVKLNGVEYSGFNNRTKAYVKNLSKTSYQKTGIIMGAYVSTENRFVKENGKDVENPDTWEHVIWNNNFVAGGPLTAPIQ